MPEENHTDATETSATEKDMRKDGAEKGKRKKRKPLFNDQDRDNITWFCSTYLKKRTPWLGLVMAMILVQGVAYQQFISLTESGLGAIAHFERRLISDRTRDGIAAARKRGKNPGRPKLDTETVSALQKLVKAGMTPGTAAKQLGIGRSTAYRVAKALD
jgi:hypothetical protein